MFHERRLLTVLLFVAMGDQDVGGLLQAQAEELHLLLAVLVDFKNLVFESSSVDVVFKDINPVWLGNPFRTEQKKYNSTNGKSEVNSQRLG